MVLAHDGANFKLAKMKKIEYQDVGSDCITQHTRTFIMRFFSDIFSFFSITFSFFLSLSLSFICVCLRGVGTVIVSGCLPYRSVLMKPRELKSEKCAGELMRFMCPFCSIDGILPRDSPIKTDLTSQSCFPRYISPTCTFYISCSRL